MTWYFPSHDLYFLSHDLYFLSHDLYFLSHDLVQELYRASLSTGFFWVDDVYTTGILPLKVNDKRSVFIFMKKRCLYVK